MNASNFRIEEIRKATVGSRAVKMFKAYELRGNVFVFCGQFSAPARTANKDLWKIAADA